MDDMLASAIELVAAEVAKVPLLGYRIAQLTAPGGGNHTQAARQLWMPQRWMRNENGGWTIDVKRFWACRPLDELLVKGSAVTMPVRSLAEELADFAGRWAISSQFLHDCVRSSPPIKALVVAGGDAEALVWREGMVIGAHEPLATALRLLIADFSEAARKTYVYAQPQLLESALRLLPDDVKSRYVPGAAGFYEQALRELHQRTVERQQRLKQIAPRIKLLP
jgi:hypothetical protein